MRYSFDIIGSKEKAIAIIEIRDDVDEKQAAEEIMKKHKNIATVLKKTSERKGVMRKREYEFILGDKNTEVIHRESGCRFKLDITKTYFSNREVTERQRIADMVKPGENVLVMFGGIGPFAIVIAKRQKEVEKVVSIEINPKAHEYAKENVKLNKLEGKVIPILGDVNKKCNEFFYEMDRVIMPLPHEAINYLNLAKRCLKEKGGVIDLYIIEDEDKIEERAKKIAEKIDAKSYKTKKVLPYSPGSNKYCIDIKFR
jgi:tRNA (guanine37-N1)-methyltransferase